MFYDQALPAASIVKKALAFLLFVLFLWRRLAFHRSSKYINPELLPFYCSRFLLDLSVRLRKDGKKWAAACGG